MEFRHIEYFLKVAETQHMRKAAEELHIAQPALSKTIQRLEEDLETDLFERVGNRIRLNEAGRIFLGYARTIMDASESARRELREYKATENATIVVNMSLSLATVMQAVTEFSQQYPSISFKFTRSGMPDDELAPGTLPDFELFGSAVPVIQEDSATLLTESICLGVPYSNPLSRRRSVRLEELADEKLLLTSPLHSSLNEIMLMNCKLSGFVPKTLIRVNTTADLTSLLRNGVGVAFVPEISWYYSQRETGYALIPIEGTQCHRCVNVRWKNSGYISKASLLFREFLQDYVPKETEEVRRRYCLNESDDSYSDIN